MKRTDIQRNAEYSDGRGNWRKVLEAGNKLIAYRTIIERYETVRYPRVETATPRQFSRWVDVVK